MILMEQCNSILINRFFSKNTFRQIISEGKSSTFSDTIDRYVDNKETLNNNVDYINAVYHYLDINYRNEYFYKNTLLNKLLLGRHSLNTTTALTELPIGGSVADFILINGKAVVYEIKTELDNFERLQGQIFDYYKAFTRVTVVTAEKNYSEISGLLAGTPVGICILTSRDTLRFRKEPEEYKKSLDHTVIFNILRKSEFGSILKQNYPFLPSVSDFDYYRSCENLFNKIDIEIAYNAFIKELKKRSNVNKDYFTEMPYSMKFLTYFSNYSNKDYSRLISFLNS